MQCAVIEFARNVCGIDADSEVIHKKRNSNGEMRLGSYSCNIKPGTLLYEAYGTDTVSERYRNKYEFNNKYKEEITSKGMIISATSPDEILAEAIELENHPWFVGTQYHPEYKSRANRPHPVFREFIKAALKHQQK